LFALFKCFTIFAQLNYADMAKKTTNFKIKKTHTQIKLGEIFEVEGKFYAIQIPKTASEDAYLEGGRQIYEFTIIPE